MAARRARRLRPSSRHLLALATLTGALLACTPAPAQARAGDLDRSFGRGGKVSTPLGEGSNPFVSGLAREPGGRLFVLGSIGQATDQIIGYRPDGSLDAGFGTRGRVRLSDDDTSGEFDLIGLPDGSVVSGAGFQFGLTRLRRDGSLDEQFGSGGRAFHPEGGAALSLARMKDGRLVAAGSVSPYPGLARFHPDGSLDASFGGDGLVVTRRAHAAKVVDHVVQPDGKVVALVADAEAYGPEAAISLIRYREDGALDRSFGARGEVQVAVKTDEAGELALGRDGRIVVSGGVPGANVLLARYLPDGSPDRSFGRGGRVIERFTRLSSGQVPVAGQTLALAPSGRIFVAGQTDSGDDFLIAGFNRRGSLDASFGRRGVVTTSFGPPGLYGGDYDSVRKILLQPDGRLLAAGDKACCGGRPAYILARYHTERLGRVGKVPRMRVRAAVAGGLRVPLRCTQRCRARVSARVSDALASRLRIAPVIGRGGITLSGGRRRMVTVRVRSRAARRLRMPARLTVRVTFEAGGRTPEAARRRLVVTR